MQDRTKLGAAVVGGYILGRTKKGGLALRTAMWISGNPEVVAQGRSAVSGVLASAEAKQITQQVSGPLVDAARQAALRALLGRIGSLSDNLANRTARLTGDTVTSTAEGVNETASELGDTASGLLGDKGGVDEQEEPDTDEPDEQGGEESEEHEGEPSEDDEPEEPKEEPKQGQRRGRRAKSDA